MPILPKGGSQKIQLDGDAGDAGRPADVTIKTQFGEYRVHQNEPGGDAWMRLETRPAFEIALIDVKVDPMTVIIVRKNGITKVPGGYLGDDADAHNDEMRGRIRADLGIEFDSKTLMSLGSLSGHPEIVTPIKLFFSTVWERVGDPDPTLEVMDVPLEGAFGMADEQDISNDTGIVLLLRLYYQIKEGYWGVNF